ncbi:hypothetical protein Q8F55_000138 [Vanrija albida]|uniref:Uncharacterized protein n=1 Tax=Vanrija albida TaxID=181172 RepID=A0ABR3QCG6_9TREE
MSESTTPTPTSSRVLGAQGWNGGGVYPQTSSTWTFFAPTSTSTSDSSNQTGKKMNVYYLVFLGILGALVVLACLLTMRSYRLRRQYRTAAQLAIARGAPFPPNWWANPRARPPPPDELWDGGVYTGGPPPGPLSEWAIVGGRAPHGGQRRERRWVRIPVLWDAKPTPEYEEEVDAEPWWASWGQPLTAQSLAPAPPLHRPGPVSPMPPPPPPPRLFRRNREPPAPPPPPPPPKIEREIKRTLEAGEPMRVAVVIQMPGYERRAVEDDDDDDEIVGWEPGMELGVWTGSVVPTSQRGTYTPQSEKEM